MTLNKICLVYATWCVPCENFKCLTWPRIKQKYEGKIKFQEIDFDDQPELVEKYKIKTIPHLLLCEEEGPTARVLAHVFGNASEDRVVSLIEESLKK